MLVWTIETSPVVASGIQHPAVPTGYSTRSCQFISAAGRDLSPPTKLELPWHFPLSVVSCAREPSPSRGDHATTEGLELASGLHGTSPASRLSPDIASFHRTRDRFKPLLPSPLLLLTLLLLLLFHSFWPWPSVFFSNSPSSVSFSPLSLRPLIPMPTPPRPRWPSSSHGLFTSSTMRPLPT